MSEHRETAEALVRAWWDDAHAETTANTIHVRDIRSLEDRIEAALREAHKPPPVDVSGPAMRCADSIMGGLAESYARDATPFPDSDNYRHNMVLGYVALAIMEGAAAAPREKEKR